MQADNTIQPTPLSVDELKTLGHSNGPCVTLSIPLFTAGDELRQNQSNAKSAITEAEAKLKQRGIGESEIRSLMEPVHSLAADLEGARGYAGTVVFRCPDTFRQFWTRQSVEEGVSVADHFQILPLLPMLSEGKTFYILALSQKHPRLLRCTDHSSEEVALPEYVPKDLNDEMGGTWKPDHVLDNRSSGGPSEGAMKGVAFTTSTDREDKDEYLHHYFKEVDRGVNEVLKGDTSPLVIVAVEKELALYDRVNSYPNTVKQHVHGAPNGLKGGEMHRRALEALATESEASTTHFLEQYEKLGGSERVSNSIKDIVKAAYDGRIANLLIARGKHYMGNFDEFSHRVRTHKIEEAGDEDLINASALQTLFHKGEVHVAPAGKVPHGSHMAAIFRY